ncbi:MAG: ROK family protein [Chloroflexi bacterium]|nr:ROK family protein [Chloroflexota bacterium]
MQTIIGVDLGGTLIRAAQFDTALNMKQRFEQETRAEEGADAVIDRIVETINKVMPNDKDSLLGIGLASPGPLDARAGVIIETPNLPFHNTPIVYLLEQALGCTVWMGNDADLAGLAEYQLGAGRGSTVMVYMTISTGIGGGIIIDGKPLSGNGLAGEIGHMVVDPNGPLCNCGHPGHLEGIAAGTSIARIARERIKAGADSLINEMVSGDMTEVTSKVVGDAAKRGDALAIEIIENAGWHIGLSISSLMMLLNPDKFVLGGGVTNTGELLFEPIHKAIEKYTIHPRYYEKVPIVQAELGGDIGLYGGAALVKAMQS